MERCKNCLEPVSSPAGELILNADGLCENCAENKELGQVLDEDERQNGDFDHSMNG